ncbi:MAG: hypothetical protein ACTSPA_11285 [Promethearchaeota archaeon]
MPKNILELVREFNNLVKDSISGPNCIDLNVCNGDCCFIHIDIPRVLAQYYIDQGWASKEDFKRGSTFSFEINVDLDKLRCVFFSKELNGCSLHITGLKTPQCWVYPTGLDPDSVNTSCKKADGWGINNPVSVKKAKDVLSDYVTMCQAEAKEENSPDRINQRLQALPIEKFDTITPSSIAGIEDNWDNFNILIGEGYNLGVRSFCSEVGCDFEYFKCPVVCEHLKKKLIKFLSEKLSHFIQLNGFKSQYTFMELKRQN